MHGPINIRFCISAFKLDKSTFTKVQLLSHESVVHKDERHCHDQEAVWQLRRTRATAFPHHWLPDTGRWRFPSLKAGGVREQKKCGVKAGGTQEDEGDENDRKNGSCSLVRNLLRPQVWKTLSQINREQWRNRLAKRSWSTEASCKPIKQMLRVMALPSALLL